MSDEAVRKEYEKYRKRRNHYLVDRESFVAGWQAARSAAIQECADFVRGHERRAEEHSLKTGRLVEHRDCFNKLADALLALKER